MRGNPIAWISTPNPTLDEGLEPCKTNQPRARPPTLAPSPLGRVEPSRLSVLRDNEFRHYITILRATFVALRTELILVPATALLATLISIGQDPGLTHKDLILVRVVSAAFHTNPELDRLT